MTIKFSTNYSPNFDSTKRKTSQIKFLIFHYTGMRTEKAAIKRLTDFNSKVSCNYLIKKNGEIVTIVLIYIPHGTQVNHCGKNINL